MFGQEHRQESDGDHKQVSGLLLGNPNSSSSHIPPLPPARIEGGKRVALLGPSITGVCD
jgi:hypothetical protein